MPVRQVQEDLVRDRGFKHRKQAQMERRRILDSTSPSSGRMLEKTSFPKTRQDRDVACAPPPPIITMKSKAALPVRLLPGLTPALCPRDLGSAFYFPQRESSSVTIACGWLTSHAGSAPVPWSPVPPPPDPYSCFRVDSPWTLTR